MMPVEHLLAVGEFYRLSNDLINDGYKVMFAHVINKLYLSRFVHRNGNRVTLSLNLDNGQLSQTKNGKVCFTSQVC